MRDLNEKSLRIARSFNTRMCGAKADKDIKGSDVLLVHASGH